MLQFVAHICLTFLFNLKSFQAIWSFEPIADFASILRLIFQVKMENFYGLKIVRIFFSYPSKQLFRHTLVSQKPRTYQKFLFP